ncbi:MAG: amidohydrolase family protein [Actinomycetota bacterium]|nr:amidohydrolase family protein [Actinomycetota bacterium]
MSAPDERPGELPGRGEVLVRGAWVLTVGAAGEVRDGAVHVRDGAVVEVAPFEALQRRLPDVAVVGDGTGIVAPGFVNAHTHLSEAYVTGIGSELALWEWGERIVGPVGTALVRDDACEGTKLRAVEMLLSGVTCVNDMFVHAHPGSMATLGVVDGLTAAGLRGVVSFGAEDAYPTTEALASAGVGSVLDEQEALADAADATELVGFRYGIGTLLGQSDGLLADGLALCHDRGWGVHTHLAEVRMEGPAAEKRWGARPVEAARRLGVFDTPAIVGHAIWVDDDEIVELARTGVAVAHNPVANMILGSGVCPLARLRGAGIAVGIGTDGAASNDSQDMLQAVKMAALLQKVHHVDPGVVSADDVLAMATIDGARALGLDHLIGSLDPGKRADLVLYQGTVDVAVLHDPVGQLVYGASPRSVRDVWVDGRRVVADRQPVTLDETALVAATGARAARIAHESGLAAAGVSRL